MTKTCKICKNKLEKKQRKYCNACKKQAYSAKRKIYCIRKRVINKCKCGTIVGYRKRSCAVCKKKSYDLSQRKFKLKNPNYAKLNYLNNKDYFKNKVKEWRLRNVFKFRIANHKQADKRYNRTFFPSEYITIKWFKNKFKKCSLCYYCKHEMNKIPVRNRDPKQLTAERLNNDIAHTKSNCVLACLKCNLKN